MLRCLRTCRWLPEHTACNETSATLHVEVAEGCKGGCRIGIITQCHETTTTVQSTGMALGKALMYRTAMGGVEAKVASTAGVEERVVSTYPVEMGGVEGEGHGMMVGGAEGGLEGGVLVGMVGQCIGGVEALDSMPVMLAGQ